LSSTQLSFKRRNSDEIWHCGKSHQIAITCCILWEKIHTSFEEKLKQFGRLCDLGTRQIDSQKYRKMLIKMDNAYKCVVALAPLGE
jgi:hypothetical protein